MHRQFLILGLVNLSFYSLSIGELSSGGLCFNPRHGIHAQDFLDTCWLQDERDSYSLRSQPDAVDLNHGVANNVTSAKSNPVSSPWTHDPICSFAGKATDTGFCVYTSTKFALGRGISFIGTPQSVDTISKNPVLQASSSSKQPVNKNTPLPYKVERISGRGYGLLANATLHAGSQILAYTPIIAVQGFLDDDPSKDELWRLFRVGVEQLPPRTRNMFLALQGDAGGDDMYDRFITNAFEVYDYSAVFPETARLNHDCRPNARYYFDRRTFTHHVHATRTIRPGDEITISYLSHYLTSAQRRQKIHANWNFVCTCALCSSSPSKLLASDERLDAMLDIEVDIEEGNGTAEKVERLVELYEAEELEAPAAKAYEIAATEYRKLGNLNKAREFADKAVVMGKLWLGPESLDFRRMLRLKEELELLREVDGE